MRAERFPVSVKGVVVRAGEVLLLKNDRAEWELPGGRIEPGESPQQCLAREIAEETGWTVRVGPILDSWLYDIVAASTQVFVVTYACHPLTARAPVLSSEHKAVGLFREAAVSALPMPEGYKRSIADWFARLRAEQAPQAW